MGDDGRFTFTFEKKFFLQVVHLVL